MRMKVRPYDKSHRIRPITDRRNAVSRSMYSLNIVLIMTITVGTIYAAEIGLPTSYQQTSAARQQSHGYRANNQDSHSWQAKYYMGYTGGKVQSSGDYYWNSGNTREKEQYRWPTENKKSSKKGTMMMMYQNAMAMMMMKMECQTKKRLKYIPYSYASHSVNADDASWNGHTAIVPNMLFSNYKKRTCNTDSTVEPEVIEPESSFYPTGSLSSAPTGQGSFEFALASIEPSLLVNRPSPSPTYSLRPTSLAQPGSTSLQPITGVTTTNPTVNVMLTVTSTPSETPSWKPSVQRDEQQTTPPNPRTPSTTGLLTQTAMPSPLGTRPVDTSTTSLSPSLTPSRSPGEKQQTPPPSVAKTQTLTVKPTRTSTIPPSRVGTMTQSLKPSSIFMEAPSASPSIALSNGQSIQPTIVTTNAGTKRNTSSIGFGTEIPTNPAENTKKPSSQFSLATDVPTTSSGDAPPTPAQVNTTVVANSFLVVYELSPVARNATTAEFAHVENTTMQYLQMYLNQQFALNPSAKIATFNSTVIGNTMRPTTQVAYIVTVIFTNSSERVPTVDELNLLIAVAFEQPAVDTLLSQLQLLPSGNPFMRTANVTRSHDLTGLGLSETAVNVLPPIGGGANIAVKSGGGGGGGTSKFIMPFVLSSISIVVLTILTVLCWNYLHEKQYAGSVCEGSYDPPTCYLVPVDHDESLLHDDLTDALSLHRY